MEWKDITKEKKIKPGKKRVYTYAPVDNGPGRLGLKRSYSFENPYGARKCDAYLDIPEFKETV